MNQRGLHKLTEEDKAANHSYRVGALVTLPALGTVAQAWKAPYNKEWILNQTEFEWNNDECGGCALSIVLSIREQNAIDPHFHWMMARQRAGETLKDFGVNNRDLAMTSVKVGSLLRKDCPFTFASRRDKIADPGNWEINGLRPKAVNQISGSIVWVKHEQGLDSFDVFRASVTKFNQLYGKSHSAVFGLMWNYDQNNPIINQFVESGSGHDVAVVGWDNDFAIIVNSLGIHAGKEGEFKVHRSVINKWAEVFGMFIPIDATQDQINALVDSGGKLDSYWITNLVRSITSFLIDLIVQKKTPNNELIKVIMEEQKQIEDLPKPLVGLWDTPENARHSVRVICDEKGLSLSRIVNIDGKMYQPKDIICATIMGESGFKNSAINKNLRADGSLASTDWGLCQVNDYYHVGPGRRFTSVEYLLANPGEVVSWMVDMYKAGHLDRWIAYKNNSYKKFL